MVDIEFSSGDLSSSVEELVFLVCLDAALENDERQKKKRNRSCWVKERKMRKAGNSSFHMLTDELRTEGAYSYKNYLSMNEDMFEMLLEMVSNALSKQDTKLRKSIPPNERLSATLRFLATGESYTSLSYQTGLSVSFLSKNIPEVCEILYKKLKSIYLKFPNCIEEWENIAQLYETQWNFPVCLGALDAKHIAFRARLEDGAFYRNYKGFNSIVLLALVDAKYKFISIDIGCNGRIRDSEVLRVSKLGEIIQNAETYFPKDSTIGNNRKVPYVIVADDAFPLQEHIMKPYSFKTEDPKQRIFNIRLSKARQSVECAFGIMCNRFRVLQTTMNLRVENVQKVTQACCVLHNFLIEHNISNADLATSKFGNESSNISMHQPTANKYGVRAGEIRDEFAEYFFNEGKT